MNSPATTAAAAPLSQPDLAERLRRAVAGDHEAWGLIVAAHRAQIFDAHFGSTHDRHEADDLTQRTFEIALRRLPGTPAFTHSFAHWLHGIANRVALQAHSRRRTWEELSPDLLDEAVDPAEQAASNDELEYVWARAKERLFRRDYEIYWLRFGEGLTEEQTAEAAGVSQHQVAVALHRARQILTPFRRSQS